MVAAAIDRSHAGLLDLLTSLAVVPGESNGKAAVPTIRLCVWLHHLVRTRARTNPGAWPDNPFMSLGAPCRRDSMTHLVSGN
jgi:hypothetical protein